MELIILGSSSKGNCYLLRGVTETLVIEAGISIAEVKKAMNFDLKSIVGCLITHEHGDHSKYVKDYLDHGIPVFASKGTIDAVSKSAPMSMIIISHKQMFDVGCFTIVPFDIAHDAYEPLGFFLFHKECGNVLFLTDTHFCRYKFGDLNNIIIEANYSQEIIDKNTAKGAHKVLRDRVMINHMEIGTTLSYLRQLDTSHLNNVVLIHLSDSNSDQEQFKSQVERLGICSSVHIAEKGLKINFDRTPY